MSPRVPPPPAPSEHRQAALTGVTRTLDPRVHAWRRDLADVALAGEVLAAHYARGVETACVAGSTPMRAAPDAAAAPTSELLFGEAFECLEFGAAWCWGRSVHDGYVGYVPSDAVAFPAVGPTHRVAVRRTLVFSAPSIKSPVKRRLPLGARLAAEPAEAPFVAAAGGFIHLRHIVPAGRFDPDPVEVAERFLGAPYGWGGRSDSGIDCSGLVQIALGACGIPCPRDTDQQRERVGEGVDPAGPLRRGDLVYFPGHVGLMVDAGRLLHANAFWMATVIEPLTDVVARLRPTFDAPIIAVRRLPPRG